MPPSPGQRLGEILCEPRLLQLSLDKWFISPLHRGGGQPPRRNLQVSAVSPRIVVGQGFIPRRYTVDNKMRYFGFAVGFAFAVVWMTVGLGSAIVCGLLAGLGYGAVIVAERARANATRTHERADSIATMLDEFELDNEAQIEAADDATSPLVSEAEYGWPVEDRAIVHAEAR
jgi:hypothetical protein